MPSFESATHHFQTTADATRPTNKKEIWMGVQHEGATEPENPLLAIRGLHTKEALARFAGDANRYQHWLAEFITHGPASTAQIRNAIAHGTRDTAIGLVHSLKGRVGMLGMAELHSIAQSLEVSLRNHEPTGLWLEELERTTTEMCQEIAGALAITTT